MRVLNIRSAEISAVQRDSFQLKSVKVGLAEIGLTEIDVRPGLLAEPFQILPITVVVVATSFANLGENDFRRRQHTLHERCRIENVNAGQLLLNPGDVGRRLAAASLSKDENIGRLLAGIDDGRPGTLGKLRKLGPM